MGINMQQMTCKILRGEGIECENELKRALDLEGYKTEFWDLPRLFQNPKQYLDTLTENDWIFVPGGFSFADHLGSGRLLAYELEEIKFFEKVLEVGASVWGVCNGFQVLTASGVFGDVQLKHNEFKKRPSNFEDRWVKVYSPVTKEEYFYPVRHGEGCLKIKKLAEGTNPFLSYCDDYFDNGSDDKIAGLIRKAGKSTIIGHMPHPEVLLRPEQNPDYSFVEKQNSNAKSIFKF
jgi:phosphoribosylformylglycinamidine synthase